MARWLGTLIGALVLCHASAFAQSTPLRSQIYVSGLSAPVAFVQDPSNPAIQFIVQQGGVIRVIYFGVLQPMPFLDLSGVITAGGERGLLGMAIAPDYATSRRFFVYFTNPDGNIVIARFKRNPTNPLVADIATRFDLRWGGPSGVRYIDHHVNSNHNGGDLHFGPDGYLYAAVGDGGAGGDPPNNAQNPNVLLGKMLRIDVSVADGDSEGYVVPPDNPFVDNNPIPALPEIWAFGLRNPWRFSFDDPALGGTGAMFIGDVGQGAWEEIDYQPPGAGGRNYGWSAREGAHVYNSGITPAYLPIVDPIVEWGRSAARSIIGGVVNHRQLGSGGGYLNRYFFADYITGRVWSTEIVVDMSGEATAVNLMEHTAELSGGGSSVGFISAFGVDAQGAIYMLNHSAGTVLRITTAHPTPAVQRTDLTGDGIPDLTVYRPESAVLFVRGGGFGSIGMRGDIPVLCACGYTAGTVQTFRPSTGKWNLDFFNSFGAPGDVPLAFDFDGNGGDDLFVYRPSTGFWFSRFGFSTVWGQRGDIPVPADYDGDGADNIAVYRPWNGTWYVRGGQYVQWGMPGDIPAAADYDNDGVVDIAVFRPSTGQWLIRGIGTMTWGTAGDIPVPMDVDRDGRAELIVFRPSTGVWFIRHLMSGATETVQWGAPGDVPLGRTSPMPRWRIGDFDGDQRSDVTIFRPSSTAWFTSHSFSNYTTFMTSTFGQSTDIPVAGDFDGDGRQDIAQFRPSTGTWHILPSSTNYAPPITRNWGTSGDIPIPADYDGDGMTDLAVFRPSSGRWHVLFSSGLPALNMQWGLSGDIPRPADYDGDGLADLAVFRPSMGRWFIFDRFTGTSTIRDWGLNGDVPLAADFDGDRRADLTVYRPSEGRWYILRSTTNSYSPIDWGLVDDVPMPQDFDGDGVAEIAVYRPSTGRWFVRGWLTKDWGLAGDVAVPNSR